MPAAACAVIFDDGFATSMVRARRNVIRNRLSKARPPGAAVVLVLRTKQRQAARGANVSSVAPLGIQRAAARELGFLQKQNLEALRIQELMPWHVAPLKRRK